VGGKNPAIGHRRFRQIALRMQRLAEAKARIAVVG
jgi:hypothetical protein